MQIRLMAEITDDSRKKVVAPIEIEREIPSMEEFGDSSKFYETFDRYERPVLDARAELMEKLTKEYLEQAALKKKMGTDRKCELEAEVGRICIENGSNIVPGHQPKERIYSLSFTELALKAGTELSFGDAVEMLNRLLHREENKAIKGRTYQDFCHRSGQKLTDYMAENTKKILEQAHFDNKTGKPYDEAALPSMLKETGANLPAATNIQQTIQTFNASRQSADEQIQTDAFEMEIPEETCYVSIDDIGVKHQKEHRKGSSQKQGVYVWNTVAVVQSQQDLYTLTGVGMPQVFRSTLAYLLAHGLLCHKNLVFFTDGANNIRCNIAETFSFHPYTIILDWYHLKKRCQECLSMSIRGGKEKRNLILQKLLRILWVGNGEYLLIDRNMLKWSKEG